MKLTRCCNALVILLIEIFRWTLADIHIPIESLDGLTQRFGASLSSICKDAMAATAFRHDYVMNEPRVVQIDGNEMILEMKRKMEDMLSKKVAAVGKLVQTAEEAYAAHKYDPEIMMEYPKAKKLNTTEFLLEDNEHFNYIPVNLSMSTVHVPTTVYDESVEIVNGVAWSKALDDVFVENYNNDSTLTWQYFGSADGFFRNYPGIEWKTDDLRKHKLDMYDCRTRGWYIQAATSPKDVVILLDTSGSMTGLRMEIAKATVRKIIDTLSDNDFFNVMSFSSRVNYIDECFNSTLIQANADNKKRVKEALDNLKTELIANFEDALKEAFQLFQLMNETGKGAQCNKAIMIITDGAPDKYSDIFREYNWDPQNNVRVFTFLIGREISDPDNVRWMACANKGYYSHISTLADVHEHVQDYAQVLSRPMVIERSKNTSWSSVYIDAADYLKVVSRPMVIAQPDIEIWTSVYISAESNEGLQFENQTGKGIDDLDTDIHGRFSQVLGRFKAHGETINTIQWYAGVKEDRRGLRLMTSVAQPVFDIRNDTKKKGNLLGVMGTDVPLKELTKLIPKYKLSVNGYAFAITNNGYILFHPDFRPTEGGEVKPNYNSVDLAEVELTDDQADIDNDYYWSSFPDFDMELRRNMVDRNNGSVKMTVKVHYDEMRRVAIRTNNYFYTDIDHTPFSLGIALPDGYGMYYINGTIPLKEFKISALVNDAIEPILDANIRIAPWNYCKMDTNETRQNAVKMLYRYIEYGMNGDPRYQQCDNDLVESLLYDLEVTRKALSNWMKANRDGPSRDEIAQDACIESSCSTLLRNGIELQFIGTKAGLTRFHKTQVNLTDPTFIDTHNRTIEELYYKRAVEGGDDVITFSVPFGAGEKGSPNDTVLTASMPISILASGSAGKAVAAVLGLQMKYNSFFELFASVMGNCPECDYICEDPEMECVLLDNNAYVVLSEDFSNVGKFFGEIEPTLMKELTESNTPQHDKPFNYGHKTGVFRKVDIYDYQGLCDKLRDGSSAANSFLRNPLRPLISLLSGIGWFIQEIALFFIQFNFFSWYSSDYSSAYGQEVPYETIDVDESDDNRRNTPVDYEYIEELAGVDGAQRHLLELQSALQGSKNEEETIRKWLDHIRKAYKPIGVRQCVRFQNLFTSNHLASKAGNIEGCQNWIVMQDCIKHYSIHQVPNTNLMLLAYDATCDCGNKAGEHISIKPTEIDYNDTMMCHRLQQDIYRRGPSECYAYHKSEDATQCGSASLQPSILICSLTIILGFLYTFLSTHSQR